MELKEILEKFRNEFNPENHWQGDEWVTKKLISFITEAYSSGQDKGHKNGYDLGIKIGSKSVLLKVLRIVPDENLFVSYDGSVEDYGAGQKSGFNECRNQFLQSLTTLQQEE